MGVTFNVSAVERASVPFRPPPGRPGHVELLESPVEAWGSSRLELLRAGENALLGTIHAAFAGHYPLILTPDAVWLCIAQGFAAHVCANAERLRGKLVRHEGKKTLEVRRDDFVKGSPSNPWPEVFPVFSDAIAEHIGRQRDLVVCNFSTTGPCERAASEIVLMAAMLQYFDYQVATLCGIPEITLEGTVDDWKSIRRRAQALDEYELGWWTVSLLPVLDRMIAAAEGRIDLPFWRSLYKLRDESGGSFVTGWVNVLFPYLQHRSRGTLEPNPFVGCWSAGLNANQGRGAGPEKKLFPSGIAAVPFRWKYLAEEYPMDFLGGFFGMAQDPSTLALKPAIGWAVRDALPAPRAPEGPTELRSPTILRGWHDQEAVLVAGRVFESATLTGHEIVLAGLAVENAALEAGVPVFCTVVEEPRSGDGQISRSPTRLLIGARLLSVRPGSPVFVHARSLAGELDRLTTIPESVWTRLTAAVSGTLSAKDELHLAACGECTATLVFGEPTEAESTGHLSEVDRDPRNRAARGVTVAEVGRPHPRVTSFEASPASETDRLLEAMILGASETASGYCLVVREARPKRRGA